MIISVAGSDGAGKSTLAHSLVEALQSRGVSARYVDRWEHLGTEQSPATAFVQPDVLLLRRCSVQMPSPARFLFLLWVATLSLDTARQEDGVTVLDGHWAKHAAAEIAYGVDRRWVESVVAGLPRPDLTVYLDLPATTAWDRKGRRAAPYECGLDLTCSQASFEAHQDRVRAVLQDWAQTQAWTVLDATSNPQTLLDAVLTAALPQALVEAAMAATLTPESSAVHR